MDEKWIQIALELGATKAVILPIEQVVTDRSFRAICEGNACGATAGHARPSAAASTS